jgi:dTDP-glucose pyrophosphorylase
MNAEKPVLLILAAGMGSRYGGLKQLDTFGPNGETIIDFSIYDAIEAGFSRIVFVIRKTFSEEFKERMEKRWVGKVMLDYVYQELDALPLGIDSPISREKPWGTGHAVWVAKDIIRGPFGVINADDYYGKEAMVILFRFLKKSNGSPVHFAVLAYYLENTLSENGAVNRGICEADKYGFLKSITECKGIKKAEFIYFEKDDIQCLLDSRTLVSMNMWGFQSSYFEWAEDFFVDFLKTRALTGQEEFYIPELIQKLIDEEDIKVSIIPSQSSWFGVTYQQDKPMVEMAFKKKIEKGEYSNLR